MNTSIVVRTRNLGVIRDHFRATRGWRACDVKRRPLSWLRRTFVAENTVSLVIRSQEDVRGIIERVQGHRHLHVDSKAVIIKHMAALDSEMTAAGGFWEYWETKLPAGVVAKMKRNMAAGNATTVLAIKNNDATIVEQLVAHFGSVGQAIGEAITGLGIVPDGEPVRIDLGNVQVDFMSIATTLMGTAVPNVVPQGVEEPWDYSDERDETAILDFAISNTVDRWNGGDIYDVTMSSAPEGATDPNKTSTIHNEVVGQVWGKGRAWSGVLADAEPTVLDVNALPRMDKAVGSVPKYETTGKSRKEVGQKLARAFQDRAARIEDLFNRG